MAYNLQEKSSKKYKELEIVDLPQAEIVKAADFTALYWVEVLEREYKWVKAHRVSYSLKKGEWIGCVAERKYS